MASRRPQATSSSSSASSSSSSSSHKKGRRDLGDSNFNRMLKDFGFKYNSELDAYEGDSNNFKVALDKYCADPAHLNEFKNTLANEMQDEVQLKLMLRPSIVTGFRLQNEGPSLIRSILGIDSLQPYLLQQLLHLFAAAVEDTDAPAVESLPKMILRELKWLDNIVDGSALAQDLLDTLSAISNFQKELILDIPFIIDDSSHQIIAEALLNNLSQSSDHTVVILETLSNLNLDEDVQNKAREENINKLESANVDDLPAVIKFLIQSISTPESVQQVVKALRKLKLDSFAPVAASDKGKSAAPSLDCETMIIDAFRVGLTMSKELTSGFLKEISSITSAESHTAIDAWVLLILYSTSNYKKQATSMFKKKIGSRQFDEKLFKNSFIGHSYALAKFFPNMISLGTFLMRTGHTSMTEFASFIYAMLFDIFPSKYNRQEVLGSLVAHIGSGSKAEIDAALSTLVALVENPQHLRPFSPFIKGIMDYLDNLNFEQIRKVYTVFSTIGFNYEDKSMDSELMILIQKQLSHPSFKYKQMGIIGAVAVASMMAKQDSNDFDAELLQTASRSCQRSQHCMAFLYDELGTLLSSSSRAPENLIVWLAEQAQNAFLTADENKSSFLSPVQNFNDYPASNRPELFFDLTEPSVSQQTQEDTKLYVDIYPMILRGGEDRDRLMCLASHFYLFHTCRRVMDGSLQEIDAILEFPLALCSTPYREKMGALVPTKKEDVTLCIFHAVNWVRELLNAFTFSLDSNPPTSLFARVDNAVELELYLEECLQNYPQFKPPHHTDVDILLNKPTSGIFGKKKTPISRSKGRADASPPPTPAGGTPAPSGKNSKAAKPKVEAKKALLPTIKSSLRELEIHTANLLSYCIQNEKQLITDRALCWLLEDLNTKITAMFSPPKKAFGGETVDKTNESKFLQKFTPERTLKVLFPILPGLCKQLEASAARMKSIMEADTDADETDASLIVKEIYLILQCIERLFSWDQLHQPDNADKLKTLLKIVTTKKPKPTRSQQASPLSQLVNVAYNYFDCFFQTISDFASARTLLGLLSAIVKCSPDSELVEKLSERAASILQRNWNDAKIKSENIQYVVSVQLQSNPLLYGEFVTKAFKENLETLKNSEVQVEEAIQYPTITNATLPAFFTVLFQEGANVLADLVKKIEKEDPKDIIVVTKGIVITFSELVSLARGFRQASVLAAAVNHGKNFVETFNKLMTFFEEYFMEFRDFIFSCLADYQKITRGLQIICAHGKEHKNQSIIRAVPQARKVMETSILKVKALMHTHNLQQAFGVGKLKHRTITGDVVESQVNEYRAEEEEPKPKRKRSKKAQRNDKEEENEEEEEEEEEQPLKRKRTQKNGKEEEDEEEPEEPEAEDEEGEDEDRDEEDDEEEQEQEEAEKDASSPDMVQIGDYLADDDDDDEMACGSPEL